MTACSKISATASSTAPAIDGAAADAARRIRGLVLREHGGADDALKRTSKEFALPPTPEWKAKLALQLVRTALHSSAPHRILPQVEKLGSDGLATPDLIEAARIFAVLRVVWNGPSVGIARYDGIGDASSPFGRMLTNDERLWAGEMFGAAQRAAFGVKDCYGREVIDEALRAAIEPVLLGDERLKTMAEIGALSAYTGKASQPVAGTTELIAVLRRFEYFLRPGEPLTPIDTSGHAGYPHGPCKHRLSEGMGFA